MRDEILYLRFLHIPGNPKLVLEPDYCKIRSGKIWAVVEVYTVVTAPGMQAHFRLAFH